MQEEIQQFRLDGTKIKTQISNNSNTTEDTIEAKFQKSESNNKKKKNINSNSFNIKNNKMIFNPENSKRPILILSSPITNLLNNLKIPNLKRPISGESFFIIILSLLLLLYSRNYTLYFIYILS